MSMTVSSSQHSNFGKVNNHSNNATQLKNNVAQQQRQGTDISKAAHEIVKYHFQQGCIGLSERELHDFKLIINRIYQAISIYPSQLWTSALSDLEAKRYNLDIDNTLVVRDRYNEDILSHHTFQNNGTPEASRNGLIQILNNCLRDVVSNSQDTPFNEFIIDYKYPAPPKKSLVSRFLNYIGGGFN